MSKFKVGDRVKVKFFIFDLADQNGEVVINKGDEFYAVRLDDGMMGVAHESMLTKLKPRKPLQCQDKVIVKESGKPHWKGYVWLAPWFDSERVYISTTFPTDQQPQPPSDTSVSRVARKCCTRLVKKYKPLKVGDRVVLKYKDMNSSAKVGMKGKVVHISPDVGPNILFDNPVYDDRRDQYINPKCLRKLRKKPVEFKVSDRIIDKKDGKKGVMRNLYTFIDGSFSVFIIFDNGEHAYLGGEYVSKHLRKLVKKKKPDFTAAEIAAIKAAGKAPKTSFDDIEKFMNINRRLHDLEVETDRIIDTLRLVAKDCYDRQPA